MKRDDTDELQCLMMGSSVGTVRCITELLRVGPTANFAASSAMTSTLGHDAGNPPPLNPDLPSFGLKLPLG